MNYEECRIIDAGSKVKLYKNETGLAWGTDAYLLAAYIKHAKRACELGCGNGVISLLCAAHGKCSEIKSVEIREDMAQIAKANVNLNQLEDKISVICRDIRNLKETDEDIGGRFDCVFANPPYIAHPGLSHTDAAQNDARHENHGGIDHFCAAAARLLNFKGSFVCVFRPERMAELFTAMKENGIEPKRLTVIYPNINSSPSLIITEGISGGKPGLSVSEPIIIYKDTEPKNTVLTERMQSINDRCSFAD